MREVNFTFNDLFSSINRRSSIIEDKNFVYGYYQIGNKYELGTSNFYKKMINVDMLLLEVYAVVTSFIIL